MNAPHSICLRPDGVLNPGGARSSDGDWLLSLLRKGPDAGENPVTAFFRRFASEHLRRIVAAADGGMLPSDGAIEGCRPDAMARLAILASVPPMTGGEYWNDGVHCGLYGRFEAAVRAEVEKAGGDVLAFVATLGPGWRDVGKVSLHLAENKGDKSGSRPFAFLATFVHRADDGLARHLPLSAALKAYAAQTATRSRFARRAICRTSLQILRHRVRTSRLRCRTGSERCFVPTRPSASTT